MLVKLLKEILGNPSRELRIRYDKNNFCFKFELHETVYLSSGVPLPITERRAITVKELESGPDPVGFIDYVVRSADRSLVLITERLKKDHASAANPK